MKKKPVCAELLLWLRLNLGRHCLAPLTGTDSRALATAVHALELYANGDGGTPAGSTYGHALNAFRSAVLCMQESTRELAFHAVAHVMDWPDRSKVWLICGLPPIHSPRVCAYEPSGIHRELEKKGAR